jgi:hypothetical protein
LLTLGVRVADVDWLIKEDHVAVLGPRVGIEDRSGTIGGDEAWSELKE